jgi:hypothetical protein
MLDTDEIKRAYEINLEIKFSEITSFACGRY